MNPLPIASSAIIGYLVLGSFATLLIGTLLILDRRHNPIHQFARF